MAWVEIGRDTDASSAGGIMDSRDIARLSACGHRRADHRFEHLRRDEHRLARMPAGAHEALRDLGTCSASMSAPSSAAARCPLAFRQCPARDDAGVDETRAAGLHVQADLAVVEEQVGARLQRGEHLGMRQRCARDGGGRSVEGESCAPLPFPAAPGRAILFT